MKIESDLLLDEWEERKTVKEKSVESESTTSRILAGSLFLCLLLPILLHRFNLFVLLSLSVSLCQTQQSPHRSQVPLLHSLIRALAPPEIGGETVESSPTRHNALLALPPPRPLSLRPPATTLRHSGPPPADPSRALPPSRLRPSFSATFSFSSLTSFFSQVSFHLF